MNNELETERSDLLAHLDRAVSPAHSVEALGDRLFGSGFEPASWDDLESGLPEAGVLRHGGLLLAWRRGSTPGFRIIGAHTDSPVLKVKPRPDTGGHGWRQLGVEVYGGILNNSWLDRDLGVAGVLVLRGGGSHLVDVREPIARIPQLAVHLDREVNDRGLVLDRQTHLVPVWGTGGVEPGDFVRFLAEKSGRPVDEIVAFDLCLYDLSPAAVIGADRSLIASGRLDNQLSCWAAVNALIDTGVSHRTSVVALFDHEEVGSESVSGAAGPRLGWLLESLHRGSRGGFHTALAASVCISADNAHAVHPNYPERHEPGHRPLVNRGPVLKVNANQRYATGPEGAELFVRACANAGVPHQVFVSRNNMACGSTIGPVTATRLGIPTVDVGAPQLSMHSARELCGVEDPVLLRRALSGFLGEP